jgi:toxin FitB
MFLLDTNVISEMRKPKPHGAVLAWLQSHRAAQKYLCAVTIGEIQSGIEITRAWDLPKAHEIESWVEELIAH